MNSERERMTKQTQAHIMALATAAITQIVAYVPAWAPEKQKLIATAGLVIAAVSLIAAALHALVDVVRELVDSKVKPADLAKDAEALVKAELVKVNFNSLAVDALSGNAPALVQAEVRKLLGAAPAVVVPDVPAAPAAVVDPLAPVASTP